MALFKILRGDSYRISTETTPFHDGYAYYTVDDGGFYIDAEAGGIQSRTRINPGSNGIQFTLAANKWTNGEQTVQINGITTNTNGVVGVAHGVTAEQMEAAKQSELTVSAQTNGSLTIVAKNDPPSIDIPAQIILLP